MDETTAKNLFDAGAMFLFLDVPLNTEFGIDYMSWRTGPNFRGLKMIPPGLHFIYFSPTDKKGNLGMRTGFFHHFKLKEIVVKKWNAQTETIDATYSANENDLNSFQSNKQNLDRFLAPYPFDEFKRWLSLTSNLNEVFVDQLTPLSKLISSGSSLVGETFVSKSTRSKRMTEDIFSVPSSVSDAEKRMPDMKHAVGTNIRFSVIPIDFIPEGSQPTQITKYSIDMSERLYRLLDQQQQRLPGLEKKNALLCELQFAFVCFLVGQSYEAFEQWKLLINLMCNCEKAITEHVGLYIEFLNVLYFQLKEMPEDFFVDTISKENFLTLNLHNLFDNINDVFLNPGQVTVHVKQLQEKSLKFKNYLTQRFNIDFEMEPDEFAPVIVETE